jgi:glycosyltransferase involved in cell wall biosynthesis
MKKFASDSPSKIKVTVGLCVRNSELTVREAVSSILDQDFPHELMEIIVVDGYSKDETLIIIKNSLKESDVRLKFFRENEGISKARQIVVDNAEGDYIVWVDGDMVITKSFIKKQVEFMDRNQNVGIAKGKYVPCQGYNETSVAVLEDLEFLLSTVFEGKTSSKCLGTSGCIYRVRAIKGVGGFDPYIVGVGEDMDAENRIREKGWSLYVIPAFFYETRRQTWKALWNEYYWHGQGGNRLFKKSWRVFNLYKLFPPVALFYEFARVPKAYQISRKKIAFLLPFHYAFKRTAWILGFVKSGFEQNRKIRHTKNMAVITHMR